MVRSMSRMASWATSSFMCSCWEKTIAVWTSSGRLCRYAKLMFCTAQVAWQAWLAPTAPCAV